MNQKHFRNPKLYSFQARGVKPPLFFYLEDRNSNKTTRTHASGWRVLHQQAPLIFSSVKI